MTPKLSKESFGVVMSGAQIGDKERKALTKLPPLSQLNLTPRESGNMVNRWALQPSSLSAATL